MRRRSFPVVTKAHTINNETNQPLPTVTNINIPPIQSKTAKCSIVIIIIKLVSAILVPIMIGAFTVVTTLQESKNAQLQREAEAIKMEQQQIHNDFQVAQLRIDNVYDTFMKDIYSIVIKPNCNLTESELIFARAKTLTTLEQIDERRKGYLIKFLYDSQLLYVDNYNKQFIDLSGADLSNVKFGMNGKIEEERKINLNGIQLSNIRLRNSLFQNVILHNAKFERSDLSGTIFRHTSLRAVNYSKAVLQHVQFISSTLVSTIFPTTNLRNASFLNVKLLETKFVKCDLGDSTFDYVTIGKSRFDESGLDRSKFFNVTFYYINITSMAREATHFVNVSMKNSTFRMVDLEFANFDECTLTDSLFENSDISSSLFENVDCTRCLFINTSMEDVRFDRVNFIGSNLPVNDNDFLFIIVNSILPNGTYQNSYPFGLNLLRNGDAEMGHCHRNKKCNNR